MNADKESSGVKYKKNNGGFGRSGGYSRSIFESAESDFIPAVRFPKHVKLGMAIDGYTITTINPFSVIGMKISEFNHHCDHCKMAHVNSPTRSCKGCAEGNLYKRCFSIGELIQKGIEPFVDDPEVAKDLIKKKGLPVNDTDYYAKYYDSPPLYSDKAPATNTFMRKKVRT